MRGRVDLAGGVIVRTAYARFCDEKRDRSASARIITKISHNRVAVGLIVVGARRAHPKSEWPMAEQRRANAASVSLACSFDIVDALGLR